MSSDKVQQLIPQGKDGLLKNLSELIEEYRNRNIHCLMLSYKRVEGGTRTYFIGADDPAMYILLERLKHDMFGLYAASADPLVYEHWDEEDE